MVQKMRIALIDWDGSLCSGFSLPRWIVFLEENKIVSSNETQLILDLFQTYSYGTITHDELIHRSAHIYAESLRDIAAKDIQELSEAFVLTDRKNIFSFTTDLLNYILSRNIRSYIISGSPAEILRRYKSRFPIEEVYGLELEINKGRYIGQIKINPGIAQNKRTIANYIIKSSKAVIAVGNSESDMPLFNAAEFSLIIDNEDLNLSSRYFHISSNSLSEMRKIFSQMEI